jgi:hypothetical protein
MSYAEAAVAFGYAAGDLTDRVAVVGNTPAIGPAQDIAFTYNGNLISGMTATGASPAQVTYAYDDNFFPTSMNLTMARTALECRLGRGRPATGFAVHVHLHQFCGRRASATPYRARAMPLRSMACPTARTNQWDGTPYS